MRGTVAKRLRKEVALKNPPRGKFYRHDDGSIRMEPKCARALYLKAKKAHYGN